MGLDQERLRVLTGEGRAHPPATGFFGKVLGVAAGAAVLVVAFFFSILLFAVVLTVGLVGWGYLWWKTRELRKVIREQGGIGTIIREQNGTGARGQRVTIIEGEVIRNGKSDRESSE